MRELQPPDFGDVRDGHARLEAAARPLVLGGLSRGEPFQWRLGAAAQGSARAGLLQDGVAAARQAEARHGDAGTLPSECLVEVDETEIPFRGKNEPPGGGQGRSHRGKILVACAAEVKDRALCRIRLERIQDFGRASLHAFIEKTVSPGVHVKTDGWSGYGGLKGQTHEPQVLGSMPAHIVLPWVHRVFSNLKRWALGVFHGLRKKHAQAYLDEFVFRFNRRKNRPSGFAALLRNAVRIPSSTYKILIEQEPTG